MINLIPNEQKKRMKRGFYYRLVVVFLIMFLVIVLLSTLAILPSYFLSFSENTLINQKLEVQKNELVPVGDQKILVAVGDLDSKLNLIENRQSVRFVVSEKIINPLILNKMPGIRITSIFYENDPTLGKKVRIGGTAPSREILLLFRRAIEDDALFKQVDLPISNFVKGSNIEFSLNRIRS